MRKKVFDTSMISLYMKYLLPTMFAMVMYSCYIFADIFFVSKGIGKLGLAAVSISLPAYTVYSTFAMMIGVGGAVTITFLKSSGDKESADSAFTLMSLASIAIMAVLTICSLVFLDELVAVLGADASIHSYARAYLLPAIWGVPFYMIQGTMLINVRADGSPKLAMGAGLVGNITNIVLDYLFIMVFDMGIAGASLATSIGCFLACAVLMLHFKRDICTLKPGFKKLSASLMFRIFKNGFGAAVLEISTGFVIFLINRKLMKISGPTSVAIFTVISNIGYISKNLFSGVAQSAQPLITRYYARGKKDELMMISRIGMTTAGALGLFFTAVMYLGAAEIIGFFVEKTPKILEMGIPAIRIFYILFAVIGMNTMLMYFFQSVEESALSLTLALLRGVVLITVGLGILAKYFGINGVWMTTPVAEGISFAIFFPIMLLKLKKVRAVEYEKR